MITANTTRVIVPKVECSDKEMAAIIMSAERNDRCIEKPENPEAAKRIRRSLHKLVAERLIHARNRSSLNNDKINRAMMSEYILRKRNGKSWAFTNAISTKSSHLPDAEEIEMLSKIIGADEEHIGLHLKVAPWSIEDQQNQRRRKTQTRSQTDKTSNINSPTRNETSNQRVEHTMPSAPHDHPYQQGNGPMEPAQVPGHAGDIKISHSNNNLHIHGKIWCSKKLAESLELIIPLKLIQAARHDDPSCYEISGRVHSYQLYNLMHLIYGSPRVISVQMD